MRRRTFPRVCSILVGSRLSRPQHKSSPFTHRLKQITELIEIERNLHYTPEPRTVYQLAKTLELPSERMLELSGNLVVCDSSLGQEAVRFAARSESVEKLSKDEQRALEEFVKFLSEK
jgi:hypothetical protein